MAGPAGAVEVLESREDVLKKLDDEPGMTGAYDLLKPGGKMREFFLNEVEASRCKDSRSHRYSPTFVRLRGVVPRFDAPPMGAREFDGAHWLALSHAWVPKVLLPCYVASTNGRLVPAFRRAGIPPTLPQLSVFVLFSACSPWYRCAGLLGSMHAPRPLTWRRKRVRDGVDIYLGLLASYRL